MTEAKKTSVVWVTRSQTSTMHIRGLHLALKKLALPLAELRILTVDDERGVTLPPGKYQAGEEVIDGGVTFTQDNLPAEGVLLVAEDD